MKNMLLTMMIVAASSSSMADSRFYYFKKTVDDTLVYTRVVRCGATPAATDERFAGADAVGPFADYFAAKAQRDQAVLQAKKAGNAVQLSEGVCAQ